MVVTNPSLTWERLNNVFYRLRNCFSLTWEGEDIDLKDYYVSMAPYSTAIALYPRQTSNNSVYNVLNINTPTIKTFTIYSGSGNNIYSFPWDENKNGKIVGFSWSIEEDLIVVLANGTFRNYYDFENNFYEFNLGFNAEEIGIDSVEFYSIGFVVKLRNNSFIVVNNFKNPYPRQVWFNTNENQEDIEGFDEELVLNDWTIIPPKRKYGNKIEIIISKDQTIYSLSDVGLNDISLSDGPYIFIQASPNQNLITFYSTSTNKVYISTNNFQQILKEYELESHEVLKDLNWCSNDVVILTLEDAEIRVIGPGQDFLSFYFQNDPLIFREDDGARILTNDKLEFFNRVPSKTIDIFKIGSTSPSSILLDSIDFKNSNNPTDNITALENINIIKNHLKEAINNCIEVSTEEFDEYWQKKLLKSASFAKNHVEFYNSEYFIEVIENLKILNQLRSYKVGMFLTYYQFKTIDLNLILNKLLLKRKQHLLVLKISEYLNLPKDLIYIDWCCLKIKYSNELSDDDLLKEILNKMLKIKNISFEKISRVAFQEGRIKLSIMLINYEPILIKKIPLLIEMEEYELSILKSQEILNYEIIEYLIFFLQDKLSLSDFLKILNNKTISLNYWESLMKKLNNWYFLKNYYISFDKKLSIGNLNLILGLIGKNEDDLLNDEKNDGSLSEIKISEVSSIKRINNLDVSNEDSNLNNNTIEENLIKFTKQKKQLLTTVKLYEDLKNGGNKEIVNDIKFLKQELKLIETQETLQKIFPNLNFFNSSIIETLSLLILINSYDVTESNSNSIINKKIIKFLKDFKISEKRYYWLVVEKLTEYNRTNDLKSFKINKNPPLD